MQINLQILKEINIVMIYSINLKNFKCKTIKPKKKYNKKRNKINNNKIVDQIIKS